MKIQIEKVKDRKTLASEAVVMQVLENANLSNYMVVDTTYFSDGKISNKHRHAYWFLSQEVKKGDTVMLFTGKGQNNSVIKANGINKTYNFYWNLETCVWNNDGDGALLFELNTWQVKKVNA